MKNSVYYNMLQDSITIATTPVKINIENDYSSFIPENKDTKETLSKMNSIFSGPDALPVMSSGVVGEVSSCRVAALQNEYAAALIKSGSSFFFDTDLIKARPAVVEINTIMFDSTRSLNKKEPFFAIIFENEYGKAKGLMFKDMVRISNDMDMSSENAVMSVRDVYAAVPVNDGAYFEVDLHRSFTEEELIKLEDKVLSHKNPIDTKIIELLRELPETLLYKEFTFAALSAMNQDYVNNQ